MPLFSAPEGLGDELWRARIGRELSSLRPSGALNNGIAFKKYNIPNLTVRKSSTLATAFSIGLTVACSGCVMALARGIDSYLDRSGEPLNLIVMREGRTAELNSTITRENLNNLIYLDGVAREGDQPLGLARDLTLIY